MFLYITFCVKSYQTFKKLYIIVMDIYSSQYEQIQQKDIDDEYKNLLIMREALDNPNDINNIKSFCIVYKKVKASLKVVTQNIFEAELFKTKYENALESNTILNLDCETLNIIKEQVDIKIKDLCIDALYDEHKRLRKYCDTAKELIEVVKSELCPDDNINQCPICMDNVITNVLAPCGHCLCNKCKANIKTTCFVCRARIYNIIKIYYN